VAGLGISLGENAIHPELREQRYRSLAMCHSSICSLSTAQSLAQEKVQASLKRTHGKFFRKDQRLSTADHSLVGVNRLTAKSDLSKGSERERLEPALIVDPRKRQLRLRDLLGFGAAPQPETRFGEHRDATGFPRSRANRAFQDLVEQPFPLLEPATPRIDAGKSGGRHEIGGVRRLEGSAHGDCPLQWRDGLSEFAHLDVDNTPERVRERSGEAAGALLGLAL